MGRQRVNLSATAIALALAVAAPAAAQSPELADRLWQEAQQLEAAGKAREAADAFARSAEAEAASPHPRWADYSAEVSHAATGHVQSGRPEEAFRLLTAAIARLRQAGEPTLAGTRAAQLADLSWNQAQACGKQAQWQAGGDWYMRSAETERTCPAPRWKDVANACDYAAEYYRRGNRPTESAQALGHAVTWLREAGQEALAAPLLPKWADRLWDEAQALDAQGRLVDAAGAYWRSAEAELTSPTPRWTDYRAEVGNASSCWFRSNHHEDALKHLEAALPAVRKAADAATVLELLGRLVDHRQALGRLDEALAALDEAVAATRAQGDRKALATRLNRVGQVNKAGNRFAPAIAAFEEAAALADATESWDAAAAARSNLGGVYWSWGKLKESVAYYEQAIAIDRRHGNEAGLGVTLANLGSVLQGLGRYDEARALYEQALALAKKTNQPHAISGAIGNLGTLEAARGHFEAALSHYQEALKIDRSLGDPGRVSISLGNVAAALDSLGRYDESMRTYDEALAIERRLDRPAQLSTLLNDLAVLYHTHGLYDRSLSTLEEAIAIDRKIGHNEHLAIRFGNVAFLYRQWGRPDLALQYEDEAIAIDRAAGHTPKLAIDLCNKGKTLAVLGRLDEAEACQRESLALNRGLGAESEVASALAGLADLALDRGRLDEARALYEEAMAIDRKLGRDGEVATTWHNLGGIYGRQNQWAKAREAYETSLAIDRRLGDVQGVAATLSQLGIALYESGEPAAAIRAMEESVDHWDRLRLTARGELRRDFLARIIHAYQLLVEAHAFQGHPEAALEASERSRAKLLAETIAGALQTGPTKSEAPASPTLAQVQASLGPGAAALVYANADRDRLVRLAVTGDALAMATPALDAAPTAGVVAHVPATPTRGLQLVDEPTAQSGDLAALVTAYRAALVRQDAAQTHALGRRLYDALIAPVEARLAGKTELVIVPDGVLGFVPFESLVDPHGRYLAERFTVTYSHSLAVRMLLAGRRQPGDRKPLVAFGGARYGGAVAQAYGRLGVGTWAELPGTLTEVRAIARVVPGAEVVSGPAVSETRVKAMDLGRFKVLHFATHGLAVPEAPELSALVLSQGQPGPEDGYLRAGEVAKLALHADFVNLSACETGLGKLYGGEGVVGLAQSFLAAGANGLSMSLWSVADASTATFMAELYKTAATQHVGYAEAAHRVKLRFLRGEFGEAWRHPYFWAPFVHYGR